MIPIHFSQVILLSGILASQGVSASSVLKSRDLLGHLLTRQHDSPFDMCEDICKSIISTLANCIGNQTCFCTTSNANALESCVDCVVALNPAMGGIAMEQSTLDSFNSVCQGTSVPSLTLNASSPGATSSFELVSATSSAPFSSLSLGSSSSDLSLATTPTNPFTQSVVTAATTSISSSADLPPLHYTPGLVVVGLVAGIILALV